MHTLTQTFVRAGCSRSTYRLGISRFEVEPPPCRLLRCDRGMARGTPPTHYGFSLNNCGAAGQRSGQRHYSGTLRTILPCLLAVKGVYSPNPALFFIAAGLPDSSRIDFASRLARRATRRATTAADGDGAGKSSSLLILCLLRKRRSSLLISLPFSLYFSAPFSLLFRQPPHICFLPFFTNVPSSPHTSSHMFGHHPATGQLAGRNVPSGTQDLRALRLWQSCRQWRAQPWSCMDAAPG
jgi:hypothetical protein